MLGRGWGSRQLSRCCSHLPNMYVTAVWGGTTPSPQPRHQPSTTAQATQTALFSHASPNGQRVAGSRSNPATAATRSPAGAAYPAPTFSSTTRSRASAPAASSPATLSAAPPATRTSRPSRRQTPMAPAKSTTLATATRATSSQRPTVSPSMTSSLGTRARRGPGRTVPARSLATTCASPRELRLCLGPRRACSVVP